MQDFHRQSELYTNVVLIGEQQTNNSVEEWFNIQHLEFLERTVTLKSYARSPGKLLHDMTHILMSFSISYTVIYHFIHLRP